MAAQENLIFLAYASEDAFRVGQLYKRLKENGLRPWSYEEDLKPGEHWRTRTETVLRKARFFLVCLSPQSVFKNGELQRELRLALSELEKKAPGEVYFIPALIEETELPDLTVGTVHLRDYQAVKVYEEKGFQRLIEQLQTQSGTVKPVVKKASLKQLLHDHIAEDRIAAALQVLKEHADGDHDILLLSARYTTLEKQYGRGVISREEHLLERNKIRYALLELARRLS